MKMKNVAANLLLIVAVTATAITGFNVIGSRGKLKVAVGNVDAAIEQQNNIKQQISEKNKSIITNGKSNVFDYSDVTKVTDVISQGAILENIKVFDSTKNLIKETQDATEPLNLSGTNIVEYVVKVSDTNEYVSGLAQASLPLSKVVVYPTSNMVHVRILMEDDAG